MNESDGFTANSLILIGLTFRTFSAAVSDCVRPLAVFFHEARATRSPLKEVELDVTLKVAFTLAPGATGPAIVAELLAVAFHPRGVEMLSVTSLTGSPVMFLKVTTVSCDDCGEKVWSHRRIPLTFKNI